MDLVKFSLLESKITQLAELAKRLKRENIELKSLVDELQADLEKREKVVLELQEQLARKPTEDATAYKEREAQIRARVESMLQRLDALELGL